MRAVRLGAGRSMPDGTPSLGLRGHRREQLVTSGYEAQRFDLRFFRPFRADLSIRKSSSFFPPLIAATSQRGFAPRPAQVSPDGPRYVGGTFLRCKTLTPPRQPPQLLYPSSPTAFQSRHDVQAAFRQPALAGP